MARYVYNFFVRVFMYLLPLWLGAFELTIHKAMRERNPQAFLAPGLMLSALALLIPVCFARKEPERSATAFIRWKYRGDLVLIALACTAAFVGMPLWHQMLGASLTGNLEGWPELHILNRDTITSIALVYYLIAFALAESKRLMT
jgi:hypothetical protein